jgi:hypothetical protein
MPCALLVVRRKKSESMPFHGRFNMNQELRNPPKNQHFAKTLDRYSCSQAKDF